MRVPASTLCKRFREECGDIDCSRPVINFIALNNSGMPQISVTEDIETDLNNSILYILNNDWSCKRVILTDAYIDALKRECRIKTAAALEDSIEAISDRLKEGIMYLGSGRWVKTPTTNQGYLKNIEQIRQGENI